MILFTAQGLAFLCLSLLVTLVTLELIRRRVLRESYAMLWLAIAGVLLLFGIVPDVLFWTAEMIQMDYRTVGLLVCFLGLMAIMMQFSIVLTRRAEENRRLVQRLALLQERLERLEEKTTE